MIVSPSNQYQKRAYSYVAMWVGIFYIYMYQFIMTLNIAGL